MFGEGHVQVVRDFVEVFFSVLHFGQILSEKKAQVPKNSPLSVIQESRVVVVEFGEGDGHSVESVHRHRVVSDTLHQFVEGGDESAGHEREEVGGEWLSEGSILTFSFSDRLSQRRPWTRRVGEPGREEMRGSCDLKVTPH